MADRDTIMLHVMARGSDVAVFARMEECLDTADKLRRVIGPCSIMMWADEFNSPWRWASAAPSTPNRSEEP